MALDAVHLILIIYSINIFIREEIISALELIQAKNGAVKCLVHFLSLIDKVVKMQSIN